MSDAVIDINSDLGESPEHLASGADYELMRYITSANVACGGHAGDAQTMQQTLAIAKELHVSVGAHPSYPDRANFGRIESSLTPGEIEATVQDQIASLIRVADALGLRLAHVKPHGALYHAANRSHAVAQAIGRAVMAVDSDLILVTQAGAASLEVYRAMGLRCVAEAFADRAYQPDGSLRPRTLPGALHPPEQAAQQALSIALRHIVVASDGSELPVAARTICIHSDTPGAIAIAREVNQRLQSAGVRVQPLLLSVR